MKITKSQLRRIIKEELSTKRRPPICNCKELKKAIDDAYFQERSYGQQPQYNIHGWVEEKKEECPQCFPEDEKTTQEPEAAMGPEGPIMKKTFQERNKMTKGRLKEIVKEELEKTLNDAPRPMDGMEPDYERDVELEEEKKKKKKSKAKRTAKGNVTQAAREKHATVGKDKFPIFDKKSAEAAIDLRGHTSKKNQKKIINKAAKYAPAAAKKARKVEKNK